jgi:hypothetical protein
MLGRPGGERRVLWTQSVPVLAAITSVNGASEALNRQLGDIRRDQARVIE